VLIFYIFIISLSTHAIDSRVAVSQRHHTCTYSIRCYFYNYHSV